MRRTKILATLGPASSSEEMIERLLTTGVDAFRLNFSHGKHEEHARLVRTIRDVATEIGRYLDAIRWGVPGFLAFGVLRALLAAAARARVVMLVLIAAVPGNAALNWVLVFGHLGLPGLGIAGSGWSTAITQSLMSLALALVSWKHLSIPQIAPLRESNHALAAVAAIFERHHPLAVNFKLLAAVFNRTS